LILSKPNHIKIYGHRGARGDLPENTLESFKYLFENDINAYETDILISKDLIPVITHDFRFDVGSLNKLSRYGRRFVNQKTLENQKIPKLSELLDLSSKNLSENLLINLEIKSTPDEENLTPVPEEMVKLVIQEVDKSNLQNKIIVSSFDWRTLTEIKNHYPEISRAYLTYQQQAGMKIKNTIYNRSPWMSYLPFFENHELPKIIKSQGGEAWHPYHKDITKKLVDISHQEDLPVNVWTVNKEYDMLKMVEYGVDGIMTDYPLRLKELCEKENIKWF